MSNKIDVYVTFDSIHNTWNVVNSDNQCVFFGNIDEMEEWLFENKDKYLEQVA